MKNDKTKIIFDTDIGGDCDDAGTLAMLHRLCDKGEADLLGVTCCYSSPFVAGCISAINQFYGREVPIGINYDIESSARGVYAGALCDAYENQYPSKVYKTSEGAPDTLTVLRKTLSIAEDCSVTLVVTGCLASMAKLLSSQPDEVSSLTGKELIGRKIARTVIMGGRFFESWPMVIYPDGKTNGNPVTWEWNIKATDLKAAKDICREWPGELVFSSYEIGSYIKTMVDYPKNAPKNDPVALAYNIHNGGSGRCSWDQTAMLEAVRPGVYWNYHEFGKITVNDDYVTQWTEDQNYRHTYLMPKKDYEQIRKVIDDLMLGK